MRCLRKVRCAIFAPRLAQQKRWLFKQTQIRTRVYGFRQGYRLRTNKKGLKKRWDGTKSAGSRDATNRALVLAAFFYAICVTWPRSATSLSQRKKPAKQRRRIEGGEIAPEPNNITVLMEKPLRIISKGLIFKKYARIKRINEKRAGAKYNDCTPASISPAQNAQSAIYSEAAQKTYIYTHKIKTHYIPHNPAIVLLKMCKKNSPWAYPRTFLHKNGFV